MAQTMSASMMAFARAYLRIGLHPIPVEEKGKKPLISWKKYQTTPPTDSELKEWFDGKTCNIGVILGRGVFAVDLDGEGASNLLKEKGISFPSGSPMSRTGNGFHVFLRGVDIGDHVGVLSTNGGKPQIDIRGLGYVVAPPSVHPNGSVYEWMLPPSGEIPEAPRKLLDLLGNGRAPVEPAALDWVGTAMSGVGEGQRDATCARLAGYLLNKNIPADIVKGILKNSFAKNCKPNFPGPDVDKTVDSIARKDSANSKDSQGEIKPISIREACHDLMDSLEGEQPQIIKTGYPKLDMYLSGGFKPGELIYFGARPGVGKTALSLQVGANIAAEGTNVLFVSREMMNMALVARMLSQHGNIKASSLRESRRDNVKHFWPEITKTCGKLSELPIWFTDKAVNIEEVALIAASHNPRPGFIVVDHLQLMRSKKNIKERRHQIENISYELKKIATDNGIPVLCITTLSRPNDKENARPGLHSLRESGELEHDADIVLLLHREFAKLEAEWIVAKNRSGHVGSAKLVFTPEFLKFTSALENEDIRKDAYQSESETQTEFNDT